MKIVDSSISMSGKSTSSVLHQKLTETTSWNNNPVQENSDKNADTIMISNQGKSLLEAQKTSKNSKTEDDDYISFELSDKERRKIELLQKMLEKMTGKKLKFHFIDKIKIKKPNAEQSNVPVNTTENKNLGWGFTFEHHESYQESQNMSFKSSGIVKTADGKEINFDVNLNMSREFMSRTDISIRAGAAAKDPLVINFDNNGPGLTDEKIQFDLDNDGVEDSISFLTQGSGFLALDLNGDNTINNGSELFGPKTGDGFSELSNYDSDGNNWIDENDPVYDKLRIWTKDESGNDTLFALGQKGVGAIYLGNVNTSFSMKDSANALQGEIKKTGIFLKENGTAGTIQHIDLAL